MKRDATIQRFGRVETDHSILNLSMALERMPIPTRFPVITSHYDRTRWPVPEIRIQRLATKLSCIGIERCPGYMVSEDIAYVSTTNIFDGNK
jgi:hypothetical protein